MGLPIHLVAAVNCNDIIHRTVQRGDFSLSETVKPTLASAMDIQVGPVGRHAVRCWVGGMNRAEIRVTLPPVPPFCAGALQHGEDFLAAIWLWQPDDKRPHGAVWKDPKCESAWGTAKQGQSPPIHHWERKECSPKTPLKLGVWKSV